MKRAKVMSRVFAAHEQCSSEGRVGHRLPANGERRKKSEVAAKKTRTETTTSRQISNVESSYEGQETHRVGYRGRASIDRNGRFQGRSVEE